MANTSPFPAEDAYAAARAAVAWADSSDHGWLRLAGRDRLDFLQRLSTNDFRKLTPGGGLPAVLCSATGRVIAPLIVYAADAALWLRTPPGRAAALAAYFSRLIFWNDEVEVSDESAGTAQFGLFGPAAVHLLARLLDDPELARSETGQSSAARPETGQSNAARPETGQSSAARSETGQSSAARSETGQSGPSLFDQPYGWRGREIAGSPVTVQRGGDLEVAAWTVVAPAAGADALCAQLAENAPQLTPGQVEILRVERGIPAWGHELSDQVTPLEAGLRAAISDNKGCYTGQEVIARQLNYDKVTRRLAGLRLPADAPVAELVGATVGAGKGRGGFIGTAVWSPALAGPIALAILPRDLCQPGTVVFVKQGDAELAAEVVELPFA
jgi:folate-binding protein YgfZ